ncbi:MAG: hypothetical protein LQ352_003337 [Teloschistes flavicans]|nr:MAG: hypothetical protein LQ352_003337 [Teloschistes flavicans]
MKALVISTAFALLTSVVSAHPATKPHSTYSEVSIQYQGAGPGALRYETAATDGKFFFIDVPFSVSKIRMDGAGTCTFIGTDKSITTLPAGNTKDVGSPQMQFGGYCFG